MELFYCKDCNQSSFELPETEAHHAIQVLRHEMGDALWITNGKGSFFECKIITATKKKCTVEIISEQKNALSPNKITLAIAPTKSRERMEWCLEKATEIGVTEIQFIQTKYSEKWNVASDRFEKVLIAAIKQSGQCWLPKLSSIIGFEKFINEAEKNAQKFICHNLDNTSPQLINAASKNNHIIIAIGPEGGFNDDEIKFAVTNNFKCVLLGNTRLRTETAAITALSVLQQINLKY
jgi:16S rRNA (uracil1498-N3)-methyltransferase